MDLQYMNEEALSALQEAVQQNKLYPFVVPDGLSQAGRVFSWNGVQELGPQPALLKIHGQYYVVELDHALTVHEEEANPLLNSAGVTGFECPVCGGTGYDASEKNIPCDFCGGTGEVASAWSVFDREFCELDSIVLAYCKVRTATTQDLLDNWYYISYRIGDRTYTHRLTCSYMRIVDFIRRLRFKGWEVARTQNRLEFFSFDVKDAPHEPAGVAHYDTTLWRGEQFVRLHGSYRFRGKARALFANALASGPTGETWNRLAQNGYGIVSKVSDGAFVAAVSKSYGKTFYLVEEKVK